LKQQVGVITTGVYDSYRIVAVVQGPAKPALSTLSKRFNEKYGYAYYPHLGTHCNEDFQDKWFAANGKNIEARKRMLDDGLTTRNGYEDFTEFFVSWLVRDCGFEVLPTKEINY